MRPPSKSPSQIRDDALVRLEVTKEAIAEAPKISHLFKRIGGVKAVLRYLRGSGESDARKILKAVAVVSVRAQALVPFEAFVLHAGLTTRRAYEVVAGAVFEQSADETELLASAKHPDILAQTIAMARTPCGTPERKMPHQHAGFLPMPKTQIISVRGNQMIDNRNQSQNVTILPAIEDSVRKISDRFNTRFLGADALPAIAGPVMEAETQEVEDDAE